MLPLRACAVFLIEVITRRLVPQHSGLFDLLCHL